ncbi:Protein involved in cell division [Bordetella ansorpii]|uniref:Protein involved in cell division n=1 Tax=Bordetella ansorpii TaxID=288768 RepID=A0A157NR19_9BORD|nr:Fic family protein [Bordetella ansorpii]SAI23554.1 Protein involved in cell division [Bordetella ansorpii]
MRKSDLHPHLQATCLPVPGKSGCFAVVPKPVPIFVDLPACHALLVLARRDLDLLSESIAQNQDHADLLLHMLNRREAVDSSQIEGTHTSFDGLLMHELDVGTEDAKQDRDADTTLNYVRAFTYGAHAVAQKGQSALNQDLIRALHAQLMDGDERADPGNWRRIQNWIGGFAIETASFVPPPPEELSRLMDDLQKLLQYEPESNAIVSVLMRAAIVHAQFEAIHPFRDGNGRTGRLLLPLMFKAEGEPPIHLATFLKVRQREYYRALSEAQKRLNWEPWLKLFLECVVASCRHTIQLLQRLRIIQGNWQQAVGSKTKRRDAAVWELLKLLLGQPIVTVSMVAQRLQVSFPSANTAVGILVDLDILRPANAQRRHRVFHAHEVMNALYTGLDEVLQDVVRQTQVMESPT